MFGQLFCWLDSVSLPNYCGKALRRNTVTVRSLPRFSPLTLTARNCRWMKWNGNFVSKKKMKWNGNERDVTHLFASRAFCRRPSGSKSRLKLNRAAVAVPARARSRRLASCLAVEYSSGRAGWSCLSTATLTFLARDRSSDQEQDLITVQVRSCTQVYIPHI